MAAQLDLIRPREAGPFLGGRGAGLLLVALAVGLFVLVVALSGLGGGLLVAELAAGAGLTYASGVDLRVEERIAYGAVLGPMLGALVTFAIALAAGLTAPVVLAGAGVTLLAGAAGWWYGRGAIAAGVGDALARWRRAEPLPLWVLLAACWTPTLTLLAHAYRFTSAGLVTGAVGVYADWAAHLTYAGSFAYGANFPPQFPIHPGHAMTYPFMVDFWAATLMPLGTSLTSSLVLTSGMLGLALPAVLYFATLRLVGSRLAAALATPIFTLGGGLGFVLLWRSSAQPVALLTQVPALNLQWLNPVLAWILPQRSVLFGYTLVPLGLAVLRTARRGREWLPYGFAGVATGLAPLFHLHAFGTLLAMGVIWALWDRRREWVAFLVPAVVLGGPVAWWMSTGGAAALHVEVGWLAASGGHDDNWLWFWIWNTGVFAPLMIVAMVWRGTLPEGLASRLAPIWLWFLVPNVLVFQPWDWDNTKFFAYWALLGAIAVAALLTRLVRAAPPVGAAVAAVLLVVLTLSGGVDVWNAVWGRDQRAVFTDAGGIRAAAWVRAHTPRSSIFLVAPVHNEAIPTLGGRAVMDGYPGWLWTYGFADWQRRSDDAELMLQGRPGTAALVRRYHVDYVVIGPQEVQVAHADAAYWNAAGRLVYRDDGYAIYRTRR